MGAILWFMMAGAAGYHFFRANSINNMSESNEFVLARATATRSAQASISGAWLWPDRTIVQWDADIEAFEAAAEGVTDSEAELDVVIGQWDAALQALHDDTQLGISLLRNKHRNDPAKVHMLKSLKAKGDSRAGILREALEWESAWEAADPTWVMSVGKTLAAFKTARENCVTLGKTASDFKSQTRERVGEWNALGEALNDNCVAWYGAATRVFKEGTAQGDMIRGTVPTTYNPNGLPAKPVITVALPTVAQGFHLEYHAYGATHFDLLQKMPGQTQFFKTISNHVGNVIEEHNQPVGIHQFKIFGSNAKGSGPETDVFTVEVLP